MARKARQSQEEPSDDETPEVVSQSTSKADARRNQKALQDFAAEERARKKARNRERDQKLKERAQITRSGAKKGEIRGKRLLGLDLDLDMGRREEDEDGSGDEEDGNDGIEARMLRAMSDAAGEVESGEGEDDREDDDEGDEFMGFGEEMDSDSEVEWGSGRSALSLDDEDDDGADMSDGGSGPIDPEAPSDDEDMDEDDETTLELNVRKSNRKADYLADDLFKAAFAQISQSSKNKSKKSGESTKQQTIKKRRRRTTSRVKDMVIGGRTIRMLPRASDPRSKPTARSVPSARARKFVDESLALKGKQALLKAKKRGWERRPANVGVMKCDGAPRGFVRTTH